MITPSLLGVGAVLLVAALGVHWLLQRLFLDPLAKYPGPLLAKFTNLYAAYHGWKGDIHLDIARCHRIYGHHVRYGPNRLLFDSANAVHDIYSAPATKSIRKSEAYGALVHRVPNTFTLIDKREHAWKRRVMTQGFSENALREVAEPVVQDCVQRLRSNLMDSPGSDGWSTAKDMSDWCSYFSFDVMSNVVFGQDYNLLGSEEHRGFVEDIRKSNVRIAVLYNDAIVRILKRWDKYLFPEAMEGRKGFLKYIGMFLKPQQHHIKDTENSLFSRLKAAKDPETGRSLNGTELRAETATLIAAGMDTTSTALASVFFYLCNFPYVKSSLEKEIAETFASFDDIQDGSKLRDCKYLAAVINESMRMSPPAGGPLWRCTESEGARIDGEYIAGGVDVGVGIYAVHHNANNFADPMRFEPERWVVHGSKEQGFVPAALMPFSLGPRGCFGKPLSLLELRVLTAQVVWKYEMKLAGGDKGAVGRGSPSMATVCPGREREGEFQLWDHINAVNHGPYVSFKAKK